MYIYHRLLNSLWVIIIFFIIYLFISVRVREYVRPLLSRTLFVLYCLTAYV